MSKTTSALLGGGIGAILGAGLGALVAGAKGRMAGAALGALGGAAGGAGTGYALGTDDDAAKPGKKDACPAGTYGPPGGPCVPYEPGKGGATTLPRVCGKGDVWVPNPFDPSGTCVPQLVPAFMDPLQVVTKNALSSARNRRNRS